MSLLRLLKLIAAAISTLKPKQLEILAHMLGFVFFKILRFRRKLILKNLDIAFREHYSATQKRHLAQQSYYHFILTLLEFLWSYRNDIAGDITLRNKHFIEDALKENKGVYIICLHVGNWEAMGAMLNRTLVPTYAIIKELKSQGANQFLHELRAKNRFLTISKRKKGEGFQKIKAALSRGEIVGLVMDQTRPDSPRLPFFSQSAKTNVSMAAIWRKVPAPIIPAFIHRTNACSHILEFLPQVQLTMSADKEKDIIDHSLIFNQVVEQIIKVKPEQYFWLHDRWK